MNLLESRLSAAIKVYGKEFYSAYCKEKPVVEQRYLNFEPGDPINIIIYKMLILDSAQNSLDSKHTVNLKKKDKNFVYYDMDSERVKKDLFAITKELNRFTNLSDILDRRKCQKFCIVHPMSGVKVLCEKEKWEEVVEKYGGFERLKYCTNVEGFEKKCGYLAGLINYANIMKDYLGKNKGNIILINMYLLNKGVPLPITRSGIKARRGLFSKASFETSLKSLQTSQKNLEKDELNEHTSRIIFQQTPLVGTNFNYFTFRQTFEELCTNS